MIGIQKLELIMVDIGDFFFHFRRLSFDQLGTFNNRRILDQNLHRSEHQKNICDEESSLDIGSIGADLDFDSLEHERRRSKSLDNSSQVCIDDTIVFCSSKARAISFFVFLSPKIL